MADTYGQSNTCSLLTVPCIFKTPNWTTGPESNPMALNTELLAKPQSLLAVCLLEAHVC